MKKNIVKYGISETKILILIFIIILLPVIFLLYVKYSVEQMFSSTPDIYVINKVADDTNPDSNIPQNESKPFFWRGIRLPEDSNNIFICNDNSFMDPAHWLSFQLPKNKIPALVEKITKVKYTAFVNGIYSKYSFINGGPAVGKDKILVNEYWDINNVKNGCHYEIKLFYCGVDIDRGKIFICEWSM